MSFDKERAEKIVNEMAEVLGPASVIEYCGNTSYFMSELLRANGTCPPDLAEQLALQTFFTDVIVKIFGVNKEILDLEVQKCYINMEKIVADAKAQNPPVPEPSEEKSSGAPGVTSMLDALRDVESMLGGLAETLATNNTVSPITADIVEGAAVEEKPGTCECAPPTIMAEITNENGEKVMVDTGFSVENVAAVPADANATGDGANG